MKVLHSPRLDTVLMVEDAIKDAEDYPTRMEAWNSLPKKVQYQTFKIILEYLEKSNKITFSKDNHIMWIAGNPRLESAIKSGKEY